MPKENEKDLTKSTENELNDDELEQVSGGMIELVQDEPLYGVSGRLNTKPLSGGDHLA